MSPKAGRMPFSALFISDRRLGKRKGAVLAASDFFILPYYTHLSAFCIVYLRTFIVMGGKKAVTEHKTRSVTARISIYLRLSALFPRLPAFRFPPYHKIKGSGSEKIHEGNRFHRPPESVIYSAPKMIPVGTPSCTMVCSTLPFKTT